MRATAYAVRLLDLSADWPGRSVWWAAPWAGDPEPHRVTGIEGHMGSTPLFQRPEEAVAAAAVVVHPFRAEVVALDVSDDDPGPDPELVHSQYPSCKITLTTITTWLSLST